MPPVSGTCNGRVCAHTGSPAPAAGFGAFATLAATRVFGGGAACCVAVQPTSANTAAADAHTFQSRFLIALPRSQWVGSGVPRDGANDRRFGRRECARDQRWA